MRWSATKRLGLATCTAVLAANLGGCGLPDDQRLEVVDDSSVPYNLLAPSTAPADELGPGSNTPHGRPVVFWLTQDDQLAPAGVGARCDDSPIAVVDAVLDALVAAPGATERDAGLSSALPSTARLTLVRVADGLAEVDLDPVVISDAERLPLAVGQIVLSVTSAPGVDAVRMLTSGQPVDIPLPNGVLATRDVAPEDYVALLPDRLEGPDGLHSIGCVDP